MEHNHREGMENCVENYSGGPRMRPKSSTGKSSTNLANSHQDFANGLDTCNTAKRKIVATGTAFYIIIFILSFSTIHAHTRDLSTSSQTHCPNHCTSPVGQYVSRPDNSHLNTSMKYHMPMKFLGKLQKHMSPSTSTMGHTRTSLQQTQDVIKASSRLWVFGYGSLVWKTGFKYTSKKIGFVNGLVRRFWQGDKTHRGTEEKPGRVATLEENSMGHVWGVAFELVGRDEIDTALEHLGLRECVLGGYTIRMVSFYPKDQRQESLDTLVFVANPENNNYLGKASTEQLTNEIIDSSGNAGHNVEYVTRLADFLRENVPDINDDHLFDLDKLLRKSLYENALDLDNLLSYAAEDYSYMYGSTESQEPGSHEQLPTNCIDDEQDLDSEGESVRSEDSPVPHMQFLLEDVDLFD